MGSAKNLGLAMVDFKRSIMPLDDADSPIPMAGPSQVCNFNYSALKIEKKCNFKSAKNHFLQQKKV